MEYFAQSTDNPHQGIVIRTDGKWKKFKYGYEVPKKILKSDFDWLEDAENQDGFIHYHRDWIHTSQFESLDRSGLGGEWDGAHHYSMSNGVFVKVSKDGKEYKIASYYVASKDHWDEKQAKKGMKQNPDDEEEHPHPVVEVDGKEIPIVNPNDYDWAPNLYLFSFGAYAETKMLVFGKGVESALETAAEYLKQIAPGDFVDDDELKNLFTEAKSEGLEDDEAQEKATVDLTYTESGYLPSWEWFVDDANEELVEATKEASEEFMEDPDEPFMRMNSFKKTKINWAIRPGVGWVTGVRYASGDEWIWEIREIPGPGVPLYRTIVHTPWGTFKWKRQVKSLSEAKGFAEKWIEDPTVGDASIDLTADFVAMQKNPSDCGCDMQQNPSSGYRFRMAYDIVTPESAEEGDTAENGWEVEVSDVYNDLPSLLRDVSDHTWVEWSSTIVAGQRDWIVSDGEENFQTGETKSYSLWIERVDGKPLSRREFEFINDNLPVVYGHQTKFQKNGSLATYPKDLTKLTSRQHQECIELLAQLSLAELRRRQALITRQQQVAHQRGNTDAVKNLAVMDRHVTEAIMRK